MIAFRLCPELFDGMNYQITDDPEAVITAVRQWMKDAAENGIGPGESCDIEVIEISKAEYNSLPEI